MKTLIATIALLTSLNIVMAQDTKNVSEKIIALTENNVPVKGTTAVAVYAQGITEASNVNNYERWVVSSNMQPVVSKYADPVVSSTTNYSKKIMSVYPNPATNGVVNINYTFENSGRIDIIDITGKLVKTITTSDYTNHHTIDVSNLQAGVYICIVNDGNTIMKEKIIVQ
jgi:hypothetical protein